MADAPALGAGARKGVEGQILSPTLTSPPCGEVGTGRRPLPEGATQTPRTSVRCCIRLRWPKVQVSWDRKTRKPGTRTAHHRKRTDSDPRLRATVITAWAATACCAKSKPTASEPC